MTIFDNIIYNENSFTELFKNYMCYKVFRESFLSLINITSSESSIDFDHFITQQSSNSCRPDIRIIAEETEIFIEIKVWNTPLTQNQPVEYLCELEKFDKKYKALILIVPNGYKYLVEYERRKNEYITSIPSKIIVWNDIIKSIENKELHIGNPMLNEFLQLLKEWFEPQKINVNFDFFKIMSNKQTPESIYTLVKIIDQLITELNKRGIITKKKKDFLDEYGFYFENENFSLFIGEWFYYWQKTGNSLCVSIHTEKTHISNAFVERSKDLTNQTPSLFNNVWLTYGLHIDPSFNIEIFSNKIYELVSVLDNISTTGD